MDSTLRVSGCDKASNANVARRGNKLVAAEGRATMRPQHSCQMSSSSQIIGGRHFPLLLFFWFFVVPVSFLTPDQIKSYGRYDGEPSPDDLTRYFHLDDRDRVLIGRRREKYNRLGFTIQLATVTYLALSSITQLMYLPWLSGRWPGSLGMTRTMPWKSIAMALNGWSMPPKSSAITAIAISRRYPSAFCSDAGCMRCA